jgi:hypothetical protein
MTTNNTTEAATMTTPTKTYTIGSNTYTEAQCEAAWLDFLAEDRNIEKVAEICKCSTKRVQWLVDKGRIIKEGE